MLTYQKNILLSLLAQLEVKLYDVRNEIDDKTNNLAFSGHFREASEHSYCWDTIVRNIQSIRKQINKL